MEREFRPYSLNLELTTCCPLRCPQCYCSLEGGKHLDPETAKKRLREAGDHGVKLVHLSGGESMCYPHLYEVVECAAECCGTVNVAVSGYHFDEAALNKLISAGVSGIFISLNGSTEEINSMTRDGYDLAVNALKVLKENNFPNTYINWVMHSNNTDDFENVLALAEQYNVSHLVVLSFKPDSRHELNSFPTAAQIRSLAQRIRDYKGSVKLMVETCYSQMLAVIKDTPLFGNLNVGEYKGCRAGLYSYSVNVDGMFSPCRHLDYFESFDTLDEYFAMSETIKKLIDYENNKRGACAECRYSNYCRPCAAVSSKLNGDIFFGHSACGLHE